MFCLPRFNSFGREQKVLVFGGFCGAVDDTGRANEPSRWNCVAAVVRQVLTRDPVHWGIEVCPRVLTQRDRIPVPAGAPVVVATDLTHAQSRGRREHVGQADDRRVWTERLCKIDDANGA